MPQIPEICEFNIKAGESRVELEINGDLVEFKGMRLSPEKAASLAWLVNTDIELIVRIEKKA